MSKKGRMIFFGGEEFAIVVYTNREEQVVASWIYYAPDRDYDGRQAWRYVPSRKGST